VIAAAVFHSGVLGQNRPGAGAMFGYRTAPSAVLDRASRIAGVCAAHRLTLPPAAIALPSTHAAVTGAVLDMRLRGSGRMSAPLWRTYPLNCEVTFAPKGLLDGRVPILPNR
jgi:D-threo-aldose 1-dehydrogenase